MRPYTASPDHPSTEVKSSEVATIVLKVFLQFGFMGGVLFLAAGTLLWTRAWAYLAVGLACLAANASIVFYCNPRAIVERNRKHEDTKSFDKILTAIIAVMTIMTWVVAGLDAGRFRWSYLSLGWFFPGVALHTFGMAAICWCLVTNPYLEKGIRIQTDREQVTVTTGPYAHVRHPMYLGMIVLTLGFPLMIGSVWTFSPVGVVTVLYVARTSLEDATLRRELRGYEEYTRKTCYRLLPGLW